MTADPLSVLVRTQTKEQHESAEDSPLMSELLSENITLTSHIALLEQLWFIYQALEEGAAQVMKNAPELVAFLDSKLNRLAALSESLEAANGADWRANLVEHEATRRYAADIRRAADTGDAPRYLAHHYTRYLGDLSGGRAIGRNVQRHTGASDALVSFYNFAEIPKPKLFKDAYRENLDALDWDDEQRSAFLSAVGDAYLFNGELFDDILNARQSAEG